MKKPTGFHVFRGVPTPTSTWRWLVRGWGETIARCRTRGLAIRVARALAKESKTSLRIHGTSGRILEERSYGNETRRPG